MLVLYLHGHKLANLEHELQRNIFSRRGSYKFCILTPVPDFSTVKHMKLSVTCLNHVIKSWHICEELKSNAKCSRFGMYLSMWRLRMHATYNFTTCANFTICEILGWDMWYQLIGTNFSQCEICEMWILRFNKAFHTNAVFCQCIYLYITLKRVNDCTYQNTGFLCWF